MQPKKSYNSGQFSFIASRLDTIINMQHELVLLAQHIEWEELENHFAKFYSKFGRCGVNTRLMIGLHILKHIYNLSDEMVCEQYVVNPYYQYFCGEEFFQHELKMERSSMTHWRNRVGGESLIKLLQESLSVALKSKALKARDLKRISVDTTVQEKAIKHPTEAVLHYKAIEKLSQEAKKHGINLRQSYIRVGKTAMIKVQRYRHAKQMKRAKKSMNKLRTYLGRLLRDVHRKSEKMEGSLKEAWRKAYKIKTQKPRDKDKILSWHAPEVECISKGKNHKPYEFGCKFSVISTAHRSKGGQFALGATALHNNPYDGHTLKPAIDEYEETTGVKTERIYVDKGYRGHDPSLKLYTYKSGQKRVSPAIKKEMKRRSAIEPVIGHIKNDGRLGRNYLKGKSGDVINARLAAVGYNFRLLLKWFKLLYVYFYFKNFYSKILNNFMPKNFLSILSW